MDSAAGPGERMRTEILAQKRVVETIEKWDHATIRNDAEK